MLFASSLHRWQEERRPRTVLYVLQKKNSPRENLTNEKQLERAQDSERVDAQEGF